MVCQKHRLWTRSSRRRGIKYRRIGWCPFVCQKQSQSAGELNQNKSPVLLVYSSVGPRHSYFILCTLHFGIHLGLPVETWLRLTFQNWCWQVVQNILGIPFWIGRMRKGPNNCVSMHWKREAEEEVGYYYGPEDRFGCQCQLTKQPTRSAWPNWDWILYLFSVRMRVILLQILLNKCSGRYELGVWDYNSK